MYKQNVQLKPYNSFQTEAFAGIFCQPSSISEIQRCISDHHNKEKLVIGGGCNLFFTRNFEGVVINPKLYGITEISGKESVNVLIEVMASEDWDSFVQYCVDKGYSGLENLSMIPGTVGASPVQNIGAYGAEVKDCIKEVTAIDILTNDYVSVPIDECNFSYRNSIFKQTNRYVIVSVVFKLKRNFEYIPKYADLNTELEKIENPTIQDVREAVIRIRKRKLPDHAVLPNGGSFFKNPVITREKADQLTADYPEMPLYPQNDGQIKTSAAFLIDKAGFKGKRIGNIGTYPSQPLIIVNYGTTDGNEIVNFSRLLQEKVTEKFGINLEPEIRIF